MWHLLNLHKIIKQNTNFTNKYLQMFPFVPLIKGKLTNSKNRNMSHKKDKLFNNFSVIEKSWEATIQFLSRKGWTI